ncbi:unnamed protein product [Polarella glacialis]|uniref:Glucuronosyltransferase n=1 Tax=Polarella glacialis TaxID=89957 RepID=A0A813HZQ0_POLGL|nr:unnamed protein product [Polarella glacialis]
MKVGVSFKGSCLDQSFSAAEEKYIEVGLKSHPPKRVSGELNCVGLGCEFGPQPDALGDLRPPANAVCVPSMPQVDLLKAGVDLFFTHGGQNSFTESLSVGVPMVVCPGFGDQVANAHKAVALGVGLQVERPGAVAGTGEAGEPAAATTAPTTTTTTAAAAYRKAVSAALCEVLTGPRFRAAAAVCASQLSLPGGVPRAVDILLRLTDTPSAGADAGAGEAAAQIASSPLCCF